MMRLLWALALCATALAGCSGGSAGPRDGDELVVRSTDPGATNVTSADGLGASVASKERGLFVGTVVNDAIQPIANATVRLPGMDLEDITEWDGAFAFSNLPVGNYKVVVTAAGFYDAQTIIAVKSGEITKVRFQLKAIPPPTPHHYTQAFDGYADITADSILGWTFFCGGCQFHFYAGGPGLNALVLEAVMDPFAGISAGGLGSNSFYHQLQEAGSGYYDYMSRGETNNPMNVLLKNQNVPLPQADTYMSLLVEPQSFPTPETAKRFTVYVTAWHYSEPPVGWSYLTEQQA